MIEEILPNLYRIEVPLPRSPLKATNSYVIKGREKYLIIDTGWNHEESMRALSSGLKKLDVDLTETDFFITHVHADHSGLVAKLAAETSTIYMNQADAVVLTSVWVRRDSSFAWENGFPENELQRAIEGHPGHRYGPGHLACHILKEGDVVSIGDYRFQCIETPGHTRGHMCLYEPGKRIFVSGDHILIDITPNISLWADDENPLDEYLHSLDKVYNLDVELVLTGHRSIVENHKRRIEELKHHHQTRVDEVLAILGKGNQNVYQVASQMSWDVDHKSWAVFPPSQKLFAFGEAAAHLKYLEEKGEVQKHRRGQEVVFSLK